MSRQYAPKVGLSFGAVAKAWEVLACWRDQVVRTLPAFLLRDLQHVGEVALDGCFDGLIALNMLQVIDAEAHQGCRREHDGQLQRQQGSRAVRQSPLLGHSQPRQILHSPLHWQNYKDVSGRVVKPSQTIVKSCKSGRSSTAVLTLTPPREREAGLRPV